ncbi:MAG: hypothetical protein ACYC5Y_13845 [Symbiobacteriia bacterium]
MPYGQAPTPYIQAQMPYGQAQMPYGQAPAMWPGATQGVVPQPAGANPWDLYNALQGLATPPAPPPSRGWTVGREENSQD